MCHGRAGRQRETAADGHSARRRGRQLWSRARGGGQAGGVRSPRQPVREAWTAAAAIHNGGEIAGLARFEGSKRARAPISPEKGLLLESAAGELLVRGHVALAGGGDDVVRQLRRWRDA